MSVVPEAESEGDIVIEDPVIPPHRMMLQEDDDPQLIFTAGEASRVFFGRHSQWLVNQKDGGRLVFDGQPVESLEGHRFVLSLAGVERAAHALIQNRVIDLEQLRATLLIVRQVAMVWGFAVEWDEDELTVPDGGPDFFISEVVKVFYGCPDHWLRWQEQKHPEMKAVLPRRVKGARKYSLTDVLAIAEVLHEVDEFSEAQYARVQMLVRLVAHNWGML